VREVFKTDVGVVVQHQITGPSRPDT